jgi:hypothetical protein
MSVARAREWAARCRAAGIVVHEVAGYETRGNGQSSAYEGWVNHHTATPKSNTLPGVLINGRPDLSPPLCNSCGYADGSVGLVAAHPANHAGASGGYDTSPLPRTSLFNKMVWGHEIVYEGTSPMTDAQYRTAQIVSKIGVDIWGYGDVNRIKFHAGTSITGKWDPGYANGKTYDVRAFRNTIPAGGSVPPTTTPPPAATHREVELMERINVPESLETTSIRLWLPGTDTTKIIVRPAMDKSGVVSSPVFIGNLFAWGSGGSRTKVGIGHNWKNDPNVGDRIMAAFPWALPGGLWADLEYSNKGGFQIDIVG